MEYSKYFEYGDIILIFTKLVIHKGYPGKFLVMQNDVFVGVIPKMKIKVIGTSNVGDTAKIVTFGFYK